MLVTELRRVVNQNTTFPKLKGVNEPYPFHDWSGDGSYFRYTVKHKGGITHKRVVVQEIHNLLNHCLSTNQNATRDVVNQYCPTTSSDGPCGFAVIAGVFSLLGVGGYKGSRTGIRIDDTERLRTVLS
jgi:hypothetical protein